MGGQGFPCKASRLYFLGSGNLAKGELEDCVRFPCQVFPESAGLLRFWSVTWIGATAKASFSGVLTYELTLSISYLHYLHSLVYNYNFPINTIIIITLIEIWERDGKVSCSLIIFNSPQNMYSNLAQNIKIRLQNLLIIESFCFTYSHFFLSPDF